MSHGFDHPELTAIKAVYARACDELGLTNADEDQPRRDALGRLVFELGGLAKRDTGAAVRTIKLLMCAVP